MQKLRSLVNEDIIANTEKSSPIDGKSKQSAKNIILKLIYPKIQGIFKDQYWEPINQSLRLLRDVGIKTSIIKSEYKKVNGIDQSKIWDIQIDFVDKNGKPQIINGQITAYGAGSIDDPLDRYDVTFTLY